MGYPGHIVKVGENNAGLVRRIQQQLNRLGCGPVQADGQFGPETRDAVRGLQARFTDQDGIPLKIDGELGPLTWTALFGQQSITRETTPDPARPLLARVLQIAMGELGVCEHPPFSNRGPRVNRYIERTGLQPGVFWCMCFVYWCFDEAAAQLGVANPCIRTGGCLDHWQRAKGRVSRITAAMARQDPAVVRPGQIFIIRTARPGTANAGHTGIVLEVNGGKLVTIEGNTNAGGSDNGGGVYRQTQRKVNGINVGFIDYAQ
ncbi:CHAP domain-containing protein [Hymenobacter metallicola]|uniref:CHAP domain-containing protein n=2 Tax=Hymenobacter metallicola TaxID=2563114 RepID=A0A4Z0QCH3_9BACT|nr:CHAP domain-containing protein [Hymenobacter metallicola]